jgi:hypothetical protein
MYIYVNTCNCGCRFCWTFYSWKRCSLHMMVVTTEGILTVGCSESHMTYYKVIFSRGFGKHIVLNNRKLPMWTTFYWGMFNSCLFQKFYAKWTTCWFIEYAPCNKVMNVDIACQRATTYWQWGHRVLEWK